MIKCDYGCDKEAKFTFKNSKNCCSKKSKFSIKLDELLKGIEIKGDKNILENIWYD